MAVVTKPLTIYAPLGLLGYGYPEASLRAALEAEPDLIAVDAGSTDPGPYYLGAGVSFTSRVMVKRDLGLLLRAAVERGIPLVVGSAGGAGAAPHLAWALEIVREIAAEHDLHFRLAVISADIDRDVPEAEAGGRRPDRLRDGPRRHRGRHRRLHQHRRADGPRADRRRRSSRAPRSCWPAGRSTRP